MIRHILYYLVGGALTIFSISGVVIGLEEGGVGGGISIATGVLMFLVLLWMVRPEHQGSLLPPFGIMVAGAIIMPLIFFILTPEKDTILNIEREAVQSAMYLMMLDSNLTTVDEHTTGLAINTWAAFPIGPGAVPLSNYLVEKTTQYYFCWDAEGNTWPRNDPGKEPTRKSAEKSGECSPLP